MSMICAKIDPLTIQLLYRWNSDTMLGYLHFQAAPLNKDITDWMLHFWNYPNKSVLDIVPAL